MSKKEKEENCLILITEIILKLCRSVCTKFNFGKATAIRTMRRVTYALHTLAPQFIKWPVGERATKVMIEFEKASAFPNVIGAIDGTHVKIKAPQTDKQSYVNRKWYHSIHVQVNILRMSKK